MDMVERCLVEILEGIPSEPKENILDKIQKDIALMRLESAYRGYRNQTSHYDISPEEAAQRTYETLISKGGEESLYELVGVTTRYIKKVTSIPENKWNSHDESVTINRISSRINRTIEQTKDFPLKHRKRLLTNRYKEAKNKIDEGMKSGYGSFILLTLFY